MAMSLSLRMCTRRCANIVLHNSRTKFTPQHCGLALYRMRRYASTAAAAKPSKDSKEESAQSMEEGIHQLELIRTMGNTLSFDPWARAVETFDLHVPSYRSPKKDASLRDHLSAIGQTLRNWYMNVISMRLMAKEYGFPGVKIKSSWSWKAFGIQSTDDSAWIAPIRKAALESYIQLNQAVADGDEKLVRRLSIHGEQEHYLKLIRKRDRSHVFVWKYHGERTPCRVVSVRSTPGNLDVDVRNGSSRLLVQVLVRLDTLQSLQVYSRKGALLSGQTEPKPVVEYLVFQKRMWYDSPWVVRDRFFESVEAQYQSMDL